MTNIIQDAVLPAKLSEHTMPVAELLWRLDLPWWQHEDTVYKLSAQQKSLEPLRGFFSGNIKMSN